MIGPFLKKIISSPYLALVFRLYVGYFFIYASVSKIPYPAQFSEAIANYRLVPYWVLNLVAVILPWVELVTGLFLVIGFMSRAAALLIGLLLVVFNIMVAINMYWGAPITCGCYDTVGEPIGWMKLAENFLMLLFTVQIYYCNKAVIFRGRSLTTDAGSGIPSPAGS